MTRQLNFCFDDQNPQSDHGIIPHEGIMLALEALFQQPWRHTSLVLVGPSASGKTTLSTAWAGPIKAQHITPAAVDEHLRSDQAPAFVVEDLHLYVGHHADEQALFHVFNHCLASQRRCLWTSAVPPARLTFCVPDLASRLRAAPMYTLNPPGDNDLEIITAKLFSDFQLRVDGSILSYIKNHGPRDVAGLSSFVRTLNDHVLETKKKVSIPMVRQLLALQA